MSTPQPEQIFRLSDIHFDFLRQMDKPDAAGADLGIFNKAAAHVCSHTLKGGGGGGAALSLQKC